MEGFFLAFIASLLVVISFTVTDIKKYLHRILEELKQPKQ